MIEFIVISLVELGVLILFGYCAYLFREDGK